MKRLSKRARIVLLSISVIAAFASWMIWPDGRHLRVAYFPDMAESRAERPYETLYRNGSLPRDTIARSGPRPLHYEATESDALRAGLELQLPFSVDDRAVQQSGARQFAAFCSPCHGSTGRGDGPTIMRGFQPPPSLLTQHARDLKDGQLFHIVSYGQKLMPAQATQLSQDDRWRVIVHVRTLQRSKPVDPPPFGQAPRADAQLRR